MANTSKDKSAPIKTAIGCHNFLLGEGLKKILEEDNKIKVIAVFTEGKDFLEITKTEPNIFIVDFLIFRELAENIGLEGSPKILILVGKDFSFNSEGRYKALIDRGVVGILTHFSTSPLLKKAVHAVTSGELWFDRKTLSLLATQDSRTRQRDIHLTNSEKEIISLLCQGFRNKEIAQKRNISEQTVKSHCNKAYKKFQVTDRLQLALEVYEHFPELVRPPLA